MFITVRYDDEQWVDLLYKNIRKDLYEISNYGKIRNKITGKLISQCISEKGYVMVGLMVYGKKKNKIFKLHRLVAYTFLHCDNWEDYTVNHIDGNKLDNSVFNLEMMSFVDNIRHAYKQGLNKGIRGEDNKSSILTEKVVIKICECLLLGMKTKQIRPIILDEFNIEINRYMVHDIKRKKTWRHISEKYL